MGVIVVAILLNSEFIDLCWRLCGGSHPCLRKTACAGGLGGWVYIVKKNMLGGGV